jgi:TfoX/Sxy family transcriptional regulator of competence genes
MAFDPELAERIRVVLAGVEGVTEKKMFGGLTFMLGGKMCCGIVGDRLMVRVGPSASEDALAEPFAPPMDFTRRPLGEMVYVEVEGYRADGALSHWIARGSSLPHRSECSKQGLRLPASSLLISLLRGLKSGRRGGSIRPNSNPIGATA